MKVRRNYICIYNENWAKSWKVWFSQASS